MATARRDTLLELQAVAQKKWADEKTFEVSAPRDGALPPLPGLEPPTSASPAPPYGPLSASCTPTPHAIAPLPSHLPLAIILFDPKKYSLDCCYTQSSFFFRHAIASPSTLTAPR
jgi:hypothetical protein